MAVREIDYKDGRWMELASGSCSLEVHWFFQTITPLDCPEPVKSNRKSHLSTGEDVPVTLRKVYVGFEAPRFLIDGNR